VILVDSDVLIEISRDRNPEIVESWKALRRSPEVLACCPVTVAEVWRGARAAEEEVLTHLFQIFVCVPIDEQIGRLAGDYLRLYSGGHGVDLGDALIAATAVMRGAELWTRNRKHYPMKHIVFFGHRLN
jgi:predicted nucleic acid-binding protein